MKILENLLHFFIGGFVMLIFAVINKTFIIGNMEVVFNLVGYIAPFIYGGTSGLIIGRYFNKIKYLNKQLNKRVKSLEGLVTMCSECKNICTNPEENDEERNWVNINKYLAPRKVTHGYCLKCYNKVLKDSE